MSEIHCPICNRINDTSAERCWYCQAILQPESPAESDNQQDWLDGLRGESSTPAQISNEPVPTPDEGQPEEEVPDWLARIRLREQDEREQSSLPGDESSSENGFPDWLQEIKGDINQENQNPAAPESSSAPLKPDGTSEDDTEDWIRKLGAWQSLSPVETPLQSSEPEATSTTPEPDQIASDVPQLANTNEPDWLRTFIEESSEPKNPVTTTESIPAQSQIDANEPVKSLEDQPSKENENWSKTDELPVSNSAAPIESEVKSSPEPSPLSDENAEFPEDVPDWLTDFKALSPDQDLAGQVFPTANPQTPEKTPFTGNDMMDWLADEESGGVVSERPEDAEPVDKLEMASLPPWLQALRPAKKPAAAHSQDALLSGGEPQGALAGIEGTLQGEELNQFYTRPQTYSSTLKVSESQQIRSRMLKNIADQSRWEDKEVPTTTPSRAWILRIVIALLLIAAAIAPGLIKQSPIILTSLYPQEVVQTFNSINALPAETPVLIAADFDGSLSGELNWTSQALLKHLMRRNVPIAFLSTTPVGATLMQGFLSTVAIQQNTYVPANRVVNLGYLPGGSVGLQTLAKDPASAIPLTADLQPAWQSGLLQNITKISDFGALIVITENADTARYWIEQVQPALGSTPLIVVISAQSAPMLQPYFSSGQVQGYLAGLNAATIYEELSQQPGVATINFSAFQYAMLVVTLIVFIGGVLSLVLTRPAGEGDRVSQK